MIDWTLLNLPDPQFMANIGEPPPAIAPTSDGSTRPYYGQLASYKYLRNVYLSEHNQFSEIPSNQLFNNLWPIFNVEASKLKIAKSQCVNEPHNHSKKTKPWPIENSEQPNITWPMNNGHKNSDESAKPRVQPYTFSYKDNTFQDFHNNKESFPKNDLEQKHETTNRANNGTLEASNTQPTNSKQPYDLSHSKQPNDDSHLKQPNNASNSHQPNEATHLDWKNEASHVHFQNKSSHLLGKPKHGYWPESSPEQRNNWPIYNNEDMMIDDILPENHALPAAYMMWRNLARFMSERAFHWKEAEFEFRRERVAIMYEIQLEHMRNGLLEVALEEFHRQDELMQMKRIIMKHKEPTL